MKKAKTIKLIIIGLIILGVLIFAGVSFAWIRMVKAPYENFCKQSEARCTSSSYVDNSAIQYHLYHDESAGYAYKIYDNGGFLNFTPLTLAIGMDDTTKRDGDGKMIVPEFDPDAVFLLSITYSPSGKYTCNLRIDNADAVCSNVVVTPAMDIVLFSEPQYQEKTETIINDHKEQLKAIMDYAVEMWGVK